jgi:23S rRNA (uracil1939-C5)-methyltransferase
MTGLDVDVRGSGVLPSAMLASLAAVAQQHRLARLTRHGELVALRSPPTIQVGRAVVTLPPGGFLQATEAGETALAKRVLAACGRVKTCVDLFSGIGPFALRLAEVARVHAYDSEETAITALRKAAQTTKGLKVVETTSRDLFRRPLLAQELREVDAVVFDPPRQGAQAQAREIAMSRVPIVVAVSCNPLTFARDARLLIDGGYRLVRVEPIDQFRHTPHVELVALFTR